MKDKKGINISSGKYKKGYFGFDEDTNKMNEILSTDNYYIGKNNEKKLSSIEPLSPLMVYERASLFLEEYSRNNPEYKFLKSKLRPKRKSIIDYNFDKNIYINKQEDEDHEEKIDISKSANDYLPSSLSKSLYFPSTSNYDERNDKFLISNYLKNDSITNKLMPLSDCYDENYKRLMLSTLDDSTAITGTNKTFESSDYDFQSKIDSALSVVEKFTKSSKNYDTRDSYMNNEPLISEKTLKDEKVCLVVYIFFVFITLILKIENTFEILIDSSKIKTYDVTVATWNYFINTAITQRDKTIGRLVRILISPLIICFGTFYIILYSISVIHKIFSCRVPKKLTKMFNFHKLFS